MSNFVVTDEQHVLYGQRLRRPKFRRSWRHDKSVCADRPSLAADPLLRRLKGDSRVSNMSEVRRCGMLNSRAPVKRGGGA